MMISTHLCLAPLLLLLLCSSSSIQQSHAARQVSLDCDIVIAGGSTASLAAAITAAEADRSLTVCFTEITDWPGGQMTAGKGATPQHTV
jgi:ribulose 1,5-bisphosphate synthetase/thiazole synthase